MGALGPTVKLVFAGDSRDLERKLKTVEAKTESFGSKLAKIGKGVSMLAAGGGAVNVIGGTVGALTALAGAAAVVPAVALAGAAAMNTWKLATQGFGEAVGAGLSGDVEAFAEATSKMHPEMAKAAATVAAFKPKVDELRQAVQKGFWDQFSVGIQKAGDTYLPMLRGQLPTISTELGNMAKQAVNASTTPFFTGAVSNILSKTTFTFREMRSSAADVLTGLVGIGSVGSRYLPNLGDSIGNVTARFKAWATSFEGRNQIQAWIDGGILAFRQLGEIATNVGSTLKSAFTGVGGEIDSPLAKIVQLSRKLAELAASAEGQAFFQALGTAAQAAGLIMGSTFTAALSAAVPILVALSPLITMIATTLASWAPVLGPLIVGVYAANQAITAARLGFTLYNTALDLARSKLVTTAAAWVVEHAKMAAGAAVSIAKMTAQGAVWVAGVVARGAVAVASMAVTAAATVASWVVMGVGAMANAAVMAAAWFVALGPIGWAIAAIVGLVVLVIANWERVKAATVAAWNAVSSAVSSAWNAVKSAVSSAASAVVSALSSAWNTVRSTAVSAWNGLVAAIRGGISTALGIVRALPGQILGALSGLGSLLVGAGRSLIEGLWRGIQGAIGWVKGMIGGALQSIRNLFPFSPAKEGPFSGKGYTTYSGEAMMTDFGVGIQRAEGDVKGAASSVLSSASSSLAGSGGRGAAGAAAGGGRIELVVSGGIDSAAGSFIAGLIRTGKLQVRAA